MSRSVDDVRNEKLDSLYGIGKTKDSSVKTSAQKVDRAVSGVWYQQARSQVQEKEVNAIIGCAATERDSVF